MADGGLGGKHCWRFGQPKARSPSWHRRPPSTHAHPRSVHTGYGSLHIDLKVNKEAWRPLRGQACCKQHASPTRLWDEAHPTVRQSHHSSRCHWHLTPSVTTRGATVHPVGTHPRHSSLLLRSTFLPEGRVCVCGAGPLPTVGSGVALVGPNFVSMAVFGECFAQRQRTPFVQP